MNKRFSVKIPDPLPYRETIIKLWETNLSGTPASRFEWLAQNKAVWLIAFNTKNDDFAGCMSILPRQFFLKNNIYKFGILGDFMIPRRYQVFGPARMLPKYVIQEYSTLGFDYLYTIPNKASYKLIKMCGYKEFCQIQRFVRPIDLRYFVSKYFPNLVIKNIVSYCSEFYRKLKINISDFSCLHFSASAPKAEQYEALWHNIKTRKDLLIGDRSIENLRWKYIDNPAKDYCFLTSSDANHLRGILIYYVKDGHIHLDDIICAHNYDFFMLFNKLINLAKKLKAISISFEKIKYDSTPLHFYLLGFLGTDDTLPLMVFPDLPIKNSTLVFNSSDRNI